MGKLWDWLQGKKTYLGGVAMVLTGIGEMIISYTGDKGFSNEAWTKIMAGWLAISAKSALTKKNPEPLSEPSK